jgi:hypothetical protein
MSLVRSATPLCVNCFNRDTSNSRNALEQQKGRMPRSLGAPARSHYQIEDALASRRRWTSACALDYLECARYVERVHPGATLIETAIGGEIIRSFRCGRRCRSRRGNPAWFATRSLVSRRRAYTHRSTPRTSKQSSTVAPPVDWDDWDTPLYAKPARDDHSDADGSGNVRRHGWLPPMSEEDDAAYRASFNEPALDPESIAAFWDGMNADGLPEFIEWLCDGWTTRDINAAAPIADIPASVAPAIESEPLVDDSDIPEQESEWAGCYITATA